MEHECTLLEFVLCCEAVCTCCGRIVPFSIVERHKSAGALFDIDVECKRCKGLSRLYDMLAFGALALGSSKRPKSRAAHLERVARRIDTDWGAERFARRLGKMNALREAQGLVALMDRLDEGELGSLLSHGHFDVTGSDGKTYRLYFSRHSNIAIVDEAGVPVVGWCYHAGEHISVGDNLLTQKLHIESDAESFFSMANQQREDWMEGVCAFEDWREAIWRYRKIARRAGLGEREAMPLHRLPELLLEMDLWPLSSAAPSVAAVAEAAVTAAEAPAPAEAAIAEAAVTA